MNTLMSPFSFPRPVTVHLSTCAALRVVVWKLHLFKMPPWEHFSGWLGFVHRLACLAFHVSGHCVQLSYSSVCCDIS